AALDLRVALARVIGIREDEQVARGMPGTPAVADDACAIQVIVDRQAIRDRRQREHEREQRSDGDDHRLCEQLLHAHARSVRGQSTTCTTSPVKVSNTGFASSCLTRASNSHTVLGRESWNARVVVRESPTML